MDVRVCRARNWPVGFAKRVELGVVENFVEPLVEGVAWSCGQLAAVPQVLLALSHLTGTHRHSPIVESRHFNCHMFLT
jgi:hypothetical protein